MHNNTWTDGVGDEVLRPVSYGADDTAKKVIV